MSELEIKTRILERIIEIAELEDDENAKNFPFDAPLLEGTEIEGKPCLGIDSIVTLELAVDIMEEFGVKIEDSDIKKLTTIDSIAEYVIKKQSE